MKNRVSLKIIFFLLLLSACNTDRLEVDVSDVDVEIILSRFENDLFEANPDSLVSYSAILHSKYGNFYRLYVERVLNIGLVHDPAIGYHLKSFVTDADIKSIYEESTLLYADMTAVEEELTDAFKHYKYYFPDKVIPEVVTYVSGLEYQNFTADSLIGIGLDMYLGKEYKYYRQKGFPMYKTKNMQSEYIAVDCMKNWLVSEFGMNKPAKDMLTKIVHDGKMSYLLDAMMPHADDTLKTGYTKKQLDWCVANEFNIWAHFVDKELFYVTDYKEIMKYTGEGPFTTGMPKESPAGVGSWLGWQIVRSYMDAHPEVSLEEMAVQDNAQDILNQSGYKPGK